MLKLILLSIIFVLYSFNSKAAYIPTLEQAIEAVVSVYSISYNDKKSIETFIKSSGDTGDKGSGIIIKATGLILTNNHVIDGKTAIKIILRDGRTFQAKVIAKDKQLDLAILEIEAKNLQLPVMKFAKSTSKTLIGEEVYAIGNPFGIGISVTSGIISALPSKNSFSSIGKLIQTDAAINPGNSGGALLNNNGELIGVTTGIIGRVSLGIGFAIPIDVVNLYINRTISGEKIKKYWLGFSGRNVTSEMIDRIGLTIPKGIIITDVYKDSAGEKAGIKVGDVLLKVGEVDIDSISALSFLIASLNSDNPLYLKILRNTKEITVIIKPEEPMDNIQNDKTLITFGMLKGLIVVNNSYFIANEIGSDLSISGVVVYDLDRANFLSPLGVKKGDHIVSVNSNKVDNVKSLLGILKTLGSDNKVTLVLRRNNTEIIISSTYSGG